MPKQSGALELDYAIETGPGGIPACDHLKKTLDEIWGGPLPERARVCLSGARLSIECGKPLLFGLEEDLARGEMLLVDHRARQFTRRFLRQRQPAKRTPWPAKWLEASEATLDSSVIPLNRFFLEGKLLVQVSVWRERPGLGPARRRLWEHVLPVAPEGLRRSGLPFDILIQDPEAPAEKFVRYRLLGLKESPQFETELPGPPAGYVERTPQRVQRSVRRERKSVERKESRRVAAMRRRHQLRSGGQDAAWAAQQAFLDQVKNAVNAVAHCLDRFESRGDTLRINWEDHVEACLDPDSSGSDRLRALQLLNLFKRIYEDRPLVTSAQDEDGLTPEEAAAVADAPPHPDCEEQDYGQRECRVLTFHHTLTDGGANQARLDRLAAAEWERLAIEIELPQRQIERAEGCGRVILEGFTVEINFHEQDLIEELAFAANHEIELVLAIDELLVTFDWSVDLFDWCGLLGFFVLGPFAFIDLPSWGQFVAEDVRIHVDLEPTEEGRHIRLVPDLVERASDFDGDLLLLSLNPVHLVAGLVTSAFESWFQVLNTSILEGFSRKIEDFLSREELTWPDFWHARRGPSIRPEAVLMSGDPLGGVFEAHLTQQGGLGPAIAEDIDWSQLAAGAHGAFVLSGRYINAWLNRLMDGFISGSTRIPLREIQDATDVRLPRANTIEGADEGHEEAEERVRPPFPLCDEDPPEPEGQFFNRAQLVRGAPGFGLPEPGASAIAGQISVLCEFTITAIRRDFPRQMHVVREPCVRDPGAFAEGFGGFAGFDEPFLPPAWLRGEFAWLGGFGQPPEESPRFTGAGGGPTPRGLGGAGGGAGAPGAGWEFGGGGEAPCPPPFCQWTFPPKDTVLRTYAHASVRATAEVQVGFSGREFWLPQLSLAVIRDSIEVEIEDLTTEEPFVGDARAALQDFIRTKVNDDLGAYLEPVFGDAPDRERQFLPGGINLLLLLNGIAPDVASQVTDLVSIRQSGEEEQLSYQITENLVYWSFGVQEGVTEYFES